MNKTIHVAVWSYIIEAISLPIYIRTRRQDDGKECNFRLAPDGRTLASKDTGRRARLGMFCWSSV